jgi:hypothetical protein
LRKKVTCTFEHFVSTGPGIIETDTVAYTAINIKVILGLAVMPKGSEVRTYDTIGFLALTYDVCMHSLHEPAHRALFLSLKEETADRCARLPSLSFFFLVIILVLIGVCNNLNSCCKCQSVKLLKFIDVRVKRNMYWKFEIMMWFLGTFI